MSLVARLKGVRYCGIPQITEIPLFCKFLLHKKLVIHVLSPIMRFSAILRYAIVSFYCINILVSKFNTAKSCVNPSPIFVVYLKITNYISARS